MKASLKQLRKFFEPLPMDELKELGKEGREELQEELGKAIEADPKLAYLKEVQ